MIKALISISVLTLALAGCSGFPGVYKIDIPQGNVVTQEMVDKLRPGMNRRQVRFVMGSPLVEDTFHKDRWDYIYTMKTGEGEYSRERISLHFKDDKLMGLNGDFRPNNAQAQ